jgi:predicted GNAT family acetyltransferase
MSSSTKLSGDLDLQGKKLFLEKEEGTAFIEYLNAKGKIYLTHTEVPVSLKGKGVGSEIVKLALAHIRKEGYLLVPLCPFVAAYLKRHPEEQDLLAQGFSVK